MRWTRDERARRSTRTRAGTEVDGNMGSPPVATHTASPSRLSYGRRTTGDGIDRCGYPILSNRSGRHPGGGPPGPDGPSRASGSRRSRPARRSCGGIRGRSAFLVDGERDDLPEQLGEGAMSARCPMESRSRSSRRRARPLILLGRLVHGASFLLRRSRLSGGPPIVAANDNDAEDAVVHMPLTPVDRACRRCGAMDSTSVSDPDAAVGLPRPSGSRPSGQAMAAPGSTSSGPRRAVVVAIVLSIAPLATSTQVDERADQRQLEHPQRDAPKPRTAAACETGVRPSWSYHTWNSGRGPRPSAGR